MEFLKGIGLQEIGIVVIGTILLLREIFKFIKDILATRGKAERRNGFSCPLLKPNDRGTLEWHTFKRELDERLRKLEEQKK